MRWSRALILIAMLALLAACGGGGGGEDDDGNGDNDGATQSEPAEASAAPPPDDDGNDDDGDGGNGSAGDAEAAYEQLIPPNAEEVSKTTASGLIFAGFTTPDSVDSLRSFYEDAFNDLGLEILTTTETSGAITWFVGTDENASEFGGVVSVIPDTEGGPTSVSIQIGATNQ